MVDWRKNQKNPPAPAQPAAWWKKDKAGESSDVTGDDFADDGAGCESLTLSLSLSLSLSLTLTPTPTPNPNPQP